MSEQIKENDPLFVWRHQPEEKLPVNLEQIANSRTEAMHINSRLEILMGIGAVLVLVGVVAWRLVDFASDAVVEFGLPAVSLWIAGSLYYFRRGLRRGLPSRPDAVAATGLEYYCVELERRRDHLRNGWLWYGPLILAFTLLIAIVMGRANIASHPLRQTLPLIVLLAAWTVFDVWRRRLQAKEIQREIDEIKPLSGAKETL